MNMSVNIAGVEFKNPVMEASGTFGSGMEYSEFVDCYKRRGKCTLARKSHSQNRGDLRRYDQCHWSAESGN